MYPKLLSFFLCFKFEETKHTSVLYPCSPRHNCISARRLLL